MLKRDGYDLKHIDNIFIPEKFEFSYLKILCLKEVVYAFGRETTVNNQSRYFFKCYSFLNKIWKNAADMTEDIEGFCVCAFMDKIFALGGSITGSIVNSCAEYDVNGNKWRQVSSMSQGRYYASCVVFQEQVVVSGGLAESGYYLKTNESYDVVADAWQQMPSMIESRHNHSLVAVKSKLFAIAGSNTSTCEVFDKKSEKFATLNCPFIDYFKQALLIGSKIFVFSIGRLLCYDIDKDDWVDDKEFEGIRKAYHGDCTKIDFF